jgi:tetratricopeptide (TPR) repeat protein
MLRQITLLLVVSAFSPAAESIFGQDAANPAEVQMGLGLSSLAKGDLSGAESAFRESLRINPNTVGSLVGMAGVQIQKGDSKQAESYFHKAIAVAPKEPAVQRSWSRYLVTQKRYPEAEAALKAAIADAPAAAVTQEELGELYLTSMNRPADALKAFRSAVTLDSGFGQAHYGIGAALLATGEAIHAEAELKTAAHALPGDPMPIQALGVAYMMEKKYTEAVQSFSQALTLRPGQVPWYMARAEAFEDLGAEDKALADYEACIKANEKFAPAYVKIGVIHQLHNQTADAERAYKAAISIDPTQAFAYNNLAFGSAERKEHLDDALNWASKAVELKPEFPQFQDTLGWVRRARGELVEAARVLEKAKTLKPEQPDVYYHLGVVYAEQGRGNDAATAFQQALALNSSFSNSPDARQRLAQLRAHSQ